MYVAYSALFRRSNAERIELEAFFSSAAATEQSLRSLSRLQTTRPPSLLKMCIRVEREVRFPTRNERAEEEEGKSSGEGKPDVSYRFSALFSSKADIRESPYDVLFFAGKFFPRKKRDRKERSR